MNKHTRTFFALLFSLVLLAASGCSTPKAAGLSNKQVSAVAENILQALNASDHAKFVQDFSDNLKGAFPEAQFIQLRDLLQNASGNFVSLGSPSLSNGQGYALYRFPCQFERETVLMTITFLIGGQKVEGIFFDSDNLRGAAQ
jgi:hypothetical protein